MEIQHLHKHPLKITKKREKYGTVNCNVCSEKLSGQTYACFACRFLLHESCLMLPQQIQHFLHPSCLLFLKVNPTNICDACHLPISSFSYRCNECDFDIHVKCAQLPSITSNGEKELILHFCHPHPLQLSIKIDSKSFCWICEMPCSGPTWGCEQCLFHVHKSCLEILPQRIQSELDPFPFILLNFPSYRCNFCGKKFSGMTFRSMESDHLCVNCAIVGVILPDSSKLIEHFFHPCPLMLKFSPFSTCNACFQNHSNFSYHCHKCDFFLDLECAQLGDEHELLDYRRRFCHGHPLKLSRIIKEEVPGKLCEKFDSKLLFDRSQCNSYIHSSCIEILPQTTRPNFRLSIPSFMCTTCKKACSGLIFYCSECKLKFCAKCILWPKNEFGDCGKFKSIHHFHQLTLHGRNKIDRARCCLCGEYCYSSTYDCRECNTYFHRSCAELQGEFKHPIHSLHPLTLTNSSPLDPKDKCCNLCLKKLSQNLRYYGIYHCEKCNFYLDILCASRLPSIKYQGHKHLLSVVENMHGDANCQVCKTSCKGFASLRCSECDFNLHLLCGPLPRTIKHISHVHPLTLEDYYVEDNETDEFACHVCEERRDPRLRVYCCSEGCLMICEVKCVISEVLKSLRGEQGVVELRTLYPQVASEVISEDLFFERFKPLYINEGARDENLETKYVFSLDELLDSLSDSEEEETRGTEASENENSLEECEEEDEASLEIESSSASEDNSSIRMKFNIHDGMESMYAYSRKAFEHFTNIFYDYAFKPHPVQDFCRIYKLNLYSDFLRQHEGSRMAGDYSLPETLSSIYEKIFEKDKIIGANWKLSYPKKRFIIFLICSVFYDMHVTKIVDVEEVRVRQWIGALKLAEQEVGFKIGFIVKHINLIWKAHFLIKAKEKVDSKSSELHQEIEKHSLLKEELSRKLRKTEMKLGELEEEKKEHDAYRASGASSLKHEYKDALEIKWRSCYEPLAEHQKRIAFGKLERLCPAGKTARRSIIREFIEWGS